MSGSMAELSSLTATVEELVGRVADLSTRCRADKRDDLASELDEVERALASASRRLERATRAAR